MACNKCKKKIKEAAIGITEAIIRPQEALEIDKRKKICKECPQYEIFMKKFPKCKECGCFLDLKWRSQRFCPLDKW